MSTIYELHEPALIATFYGQRGKLTTLADHLIRQRQLTQENATTFTHEATKTLLVHFNSPGAADTSVIQIALNSTDHVTIAWKALREQLEVILDDTLLQWPVWGYSLVYQAMLAQTPDTDEPFDTALLSTAQALEPVVQRLQIAGEEKLPLLASSAMPGGQISLHRVPLEHDGLEAANVYIALSLPDPDNQLVRQCLLGSGAALLMPDLIAHKVYHQIRQYRGGDWLDEYNQLVQSVRNHTDALLNLSMDDAAQSDAIPTLNQACSHMMSHVQSLKALHVSLSQQNENYSWWLEHTPGDKTVFQFHERHLQIALRELDLLIEKGAAVLNGAQTTLEHMNRQAEPTSVQQQQATEHNHPRAEPLQVTLQFTQTGQRVRIAWDSDVIGMTTSSFSPPYTGQDLRLVIRALDALQYPNYPQGAPTCTPDEQARLKALGLWNTGGISREAPRIVGQKLYAALCRSRSGAEALKVVREAARSQGRPLSYVLRFPSDAVELAALPWEALWDERQAVLLSRGGRDIDSCERYLNLDIALSPPIPSGRKLHVLALSPHTGIPQNVRDEERDARLKSWEMLKEQGLLEWDEISPVTVVSLDNWMRQNTVPDIVHYYGHGIYRNGQGSLLFDSHEQPGQPDMISASRLAAILGGIRLIMLFACQSAMVATSESDIGLLTGVAPALSVVSEIVVAMQLTTRISAANRFSEIFYEELARGRSVQAAVADARRSLYVTEGDGMSWYVPTLYIRTREQKPIAIRSDL